MASRNRIGSTGKTPVSSEEEHVRKLTKLFGAIGAGALLVTTLAGPAAADSGRVLPWFPDRSGPTVVTSGLNNPRQIALTAGDGLLVIAEAGKGGPDCQADPMDPTSEFCTGATGSISSVFVPQFGSGRQAVDLVTGLASGAGPDGSFAVGSQGVSNRSFGDIKIVSDFEGNLLKARSFGSAVPQANIAAYEEANDPDGQGVDSNPYGVLALRGRTLVADAAGNTVVSVTEGGTISTFAVLPNITDGLCAGVPNDNGMTGCDFVPTSLAEGPDGAIYVGGLGAETPGAGRVVKLDPTTGAVLATWGDLFTVTGVAVGRDGSVYASELFGGDPEAPTPGNLVKIAADGTRTSKTVPFPAGVAVDKFNNVYVSAFSTSPDTGLGIPNTDSSGQIWRLRF